MDLEASIRETELAMKTASDAELELLHRYDRILIILEDLGSRVMDIM